MVMSVWDVLPSTSGVETSPSTNNYSNLKQNQATSTLLERRRGAKIRRNLYNLIIALKCKTCGDVIDLLKLQQRLKIDRRLISAVLGILEKLGFGRKLEKGHRFEWFGVEPAARKLLSMQADLSGSTTNYYVKQLESVVDLQRSVRDSHPSFWAEFVFPYAVIEVTLSVLRISATLDQGPSELAIEVIQVLLAIPTRRAPMGNLIASEHVSRDRLIRVITILEALSLVRRRNLAERVTHGSMIEYIGPTREDPHSWSRRLLNEESCNDTTERLSWAEPTHPHANIAAIFGYDKEQLRGTLLYLERRLRLDSRHSDYSHVDHVYTPLLTLEEGETPELVPVQSMLPVQQEVEEESLSPQIRHKKSDSEGERPSSMFLVPIGKATAIEHFVVQPTYVVDHSTHS